MPSDPNFTELERKLFSSFDNPEETWMSHDGTTMIVYTPRRAVASDGKTLTAKDLEGTACTESLDGSPSPPAVMDIESERKRWMDAAMDFTGDSYIQFCANPITADHQESLYFYETDHPSSMPNWAFYNLRRARTREFVPSAEVTGKRSLAVKGRFVYSTERGFEKIANASILDRVSSAATAALGAVSKWME
jgi:hypothetical protein